MFGKLFGTNGGGNKKQQAAPVDATETITKMQN